MKGPARYGTSCCAGFLGIETKGVEDKSGALGGKTSKGKETSGAGLKKIYLGVWENQGDRYMNIYIWFNRIVDEKGKSELQ